jgi:hypothetical protein
VPQAAHTDRGRGEQAFGTRRFCQRLLVDHETLPRVAESMIRLGAICASSID